MHKALSLSEEKVRLRELGLQSTIANILQERPEFVFHLEEMIEWETANPPKDEWSGWECAQVHTAPFIVNTLINFGIVDQTDRTRSHTCYRLHSLPATKTALDSISPLGLPEKAIAPEDMFSLVVGHDKVRALLYYAVLADKPVHALLVGPPGTAKTLMLSDVGSLPGAQFYVGSTTTKSGLVGLLLAVRPRYLVIDELDKMTDSDMSPLLNLMETGLVTRLQHGARDRISLDTRVFAGANDTRRISPAILSRFAVFELPPYTPAEFVEVATQVLIQREGLGPETAKLVANVVVKFNTTDIRDAVRVARLARRDPSLVLEVAECLWQGKIKTTQPASANGHMEAIRQAQARGR